MRTLFLALTLALLPTPAPASAWSGALKQKIDAIMATHFGQHTQAGVVVGVVKGGETHIWSYGERVLGGGESPTGDTIFEMGSITKTFTGLLLAREVVEGRLSLAQKAKTLWPALAGSDAGEITLEQLATHSSGLPRMPDNFEPADHENPYEGYGEERLLSFLLRFKQAGPAPHPYAYSNVGLGLLGHLVAEKRHGRSFADRLHTEVLAPLGMHDTKVSLAPADLPRAAQGYDGFLKPVPFWNFGVLGPAGALKTTVNDLLRYARFQMQPGGGPLGAAAELGQQRRGATDNKDFGIGLVWELGRIGEHEVITHGGATGGYRANLIFDRSQGIAAVILSNTAIAPRCALAPAFGAECKPQEFQTVDPARQAPLVGRYRAEAIRMNAEVFLENGILGVYPEGQPRLRLWARSEDEYEILEAKAEFRFVRSRDGSVSAFTLHQNGQVFEFRRGQ